MQDSIHHDQEALMAWLKIRGIMSEDQADRFTRALLGIRESAVEIYDDYLARLHRQLETETGGVQDTIWDIFEPCSHIGYHLKDATLPPGA
jgi:hypothetical protein